MLIFDICGGLADKIFSWGTLHDYCSRKGIDFKLVWDVATNNCKEFQFYFSGLEFLDIENISSGDVAKKYNIDKRLSRDWGIKGNNIYDELKELCYTGYVNRFNVFVTDTGRGYSFDNISNRYNNLVIKSIKPSSYIQERLNNYISENDFNNPIGIHIRRTDNKNCIEASPDYLFYNKIEELIDKDKDVKIFLCTDDDNLKKDIKNKYGEHILTRNIKERYTKGAMEDAVIDMLLLSKCKELYGCPSGFVELASTLGKIHLNILWK